MRLFSGLFKKRAVTTRTEKEICDLLESISASVKRLDEVREADDRERTLLKEASAALYKRCASLLKLVEDYEEAKNG